MFRKLYQKWMAIANVIGNFNSRVVLSLLYAIVVLPFGLVVRVFADPLAIRRRKSSAWTTPRGATKSVEDARRQF
ncbi:TPA: hypothetical protein DCE37_05925 [Candidatus Latescibacteria bacterium]|nr:hypothetical protein [Gemmatimonadota bacterium]HAA74641.1 hypothetical protein [Candidatus Latescibacterota bacterium]